MTLPASVRRALALREGDALSIDVTDGAAILRPAVVIPRDDAWAYTPEHLAAVRRASAQVASGQVEAFPEELATKLSEPR
jgi:AbrB family looped-hinge helix DNA binding protein